MADTTPTLAQVIRLAVEQELAELRVSLPARIRSYDAGNQTADVEIMISNPLDEETEEEFPVIPCVPVVFPRATVGGWHIHFPLTAGDEGSLIFADWPIDVWRRAGEKRAPVDLRNHSLGGAQFFPGLHSSNNPVSGASGSEMTIGDSDATGSLISINQTRVKVGSGAYSACLAERVKSLETIFKAHTHPVSGGTAAASTDPAVTSLDADYGSSNLKIDD